MKASVKLKAIFNCNIERAFKAPILGDATKFLNGYLFQPPIIGFDDVENWGNINGERVPIIKGNIIVKSHRIFTDKITERNENKNWKWELSNFTSIYLFFAYKAVGEWEVNEILRDKIFVVYKYSYFSKNILCHPINWLFVKIQLKGMMRKAIKGIKKQAELNKAF